jgi:hypothetical protein
MAGLGSVSNIANGLPLRWEDHGYFADGSQVTTEVLDMVMLSQELIAVWACLFLVLNTTMTISIVYKILYVDRFASDTLN